MGQFKVDSASKPGVLQLTLEGALSLDEMKEFVALHNRSIESFNGATYRVFCDLRHMMPLSPEAAALLQTAKQFSASQPSFQGSAVLVASSVVAMQHRRTSIEGGVMSTELITDDEAACWEHLRRTQRMPHR
jgi:hypothetical protein